MVIKPNFSQPFSPQDVTGKFLNAFRHYWRNDELVNQQFMNRRGSYQFVGLIWDVNDLTRTWTLQFPVRDLLMNPSSTSCTTLHPPLSRKSNLSWWWWKPRRCCLPFFFPSRSPFSLGSGTGQPPSYSVSAATGAKPSPPPPWCSKAGDSKYIQFPSMVGRC